MSGKTILNFQPRTKLKLSEVEILIRKYRLIVPCPSRQTLIGMCENGTFESVGKDNDGRPKPTSLGWLIFEDSFVRWAQKMDGIELTV